MRRAHLLPSAASVSKITFYFRFETTGYKGVWYVGLEHNSSKEKHELFRTLYSIISQEIRR